MTRALTQNEVEIKIFILFPNLQILNKYKNSIEKLHIKCKECNHEWFVTFPNLKKIKHGCASCSGKMKLSKEKIQEKLLQINPDIEILGEYIGSHSPIKTQCKVCYHTWTPQWVNLQSGGRCPECRKRERLGLYNIKNAERNKEEWSKKKALFYILKLFNEEESFYKVGITTQKIQERAKRYPYNYEIISLECGTLYDIIFLEKKYHINNNTYSYLPKKKFGGYTECYEII